MNRRSREIAGWVKFPVNDNEWTHSNEGGMIVKLVVCEPRGEHDKFTICCGAYVRDILSESFIADDRRPRPKNMVDEESIENIDKYYNSQQEWEAYHFPFHNDDTMDGVDKFLSIEYLAVVVMGNTGWSGYNETIGEYWQCGFDDLTEDGKLLYKQFEKLYPGCELHLLTFLDT